MKYFIIQSAVSFLYMVFSVEIRAFFKNINILNIYWIFYYAIFHRFSKTYDIQFIKLFFLINFFVNVYFFHNSFKKTF